MAYDRQQLRFEFGFTLFGTDEVAYTGISFTTAPGWTGAAAALAEFGASSGAGQDPIDLMATLMSTTALGWADYSVLRSIKVSALDTSNHYLVEPFSYEDATPTKGTAAGVPPQCTVVLSLRSGFSLGRANYGRMYLPHTRPAFPAMLPVMDDTAAGAIADAGKVFVNALADRINDSTTATVFPAIMSAVGSGTAKGVTAVACGNVIDTQRRRRNGLNEFYLTRQLSA